jgi:hypothetical protein
LYKKIKKCRLCSNKNLIKVLDLGYMHISSVFPRSASNEVKRAPLELVLCSSDKAHASCGLLQLGHDFDLDFIYTDTYGYFSGLNNSMKKHLRYIARKGLLISKPMKGDLILDIGSNDSTLLNYYDKGNFKLAGIDPLAEKFEGFYKKDTTLIQGFFPQAMQIKQKARLITSIAMLYDIKDPVEFAGAINLFLDNDGIWLFELSYLPFMLKNTSYDSICHEHLTYYGAEQIDYLLKNCGFRPVYAELNTVNGGSIMIAACKQNSKLYESYEGWQDILEKEKKYRLKDIRIYRAFKERMQKQKNNLVHILRNLKKQARLVIGYGASTKGNIVLQYCNIDKKLLPAIADINNDKCGSFTPGTLIPIIHEKNARLMKPDCFLIFPWHFKASIQKKERRFLGRGNHLLIPLPKPHLVKA